MTRVVLVLIFAIVAFALTVNLAPDVVEELLFQAADSPSDAAKTADVAAESPKPAARTKSAVRTKPAAKQASSPVATTEPMTEAPIAASINQPLPPGPVPSVFSVSEDVALHSANAPSGMVISHLRKGDLVEPQYTLKTAGQEWTFVRVTDQKVSGFLRTDDYRKSEETAETTSR